jgi:hypothetical protein
VSLSFRAVFGHVRCHLVGYAALFVALGGTAVAVIPAKPADGMVTGRTAVPFEAGTSYGSVSGLSGFNDEASAATLSPGTAVSARHLAVRVVGVADGTSYVITLRADGSDTSLACTATAADPTCDSGSASVTLAPGTAIAFEIESSGPVEGGLVQYGFATSAGVKK